jgi:predicted nucleotidyltransferase
MKYGVSSLAVFGSYARGEARRDSDVDMLVAFSRRVSLLTLIALERELSELLGRKVDLQTVEGLSPYLRDRILKERQVVYAS